MGLKIFLIGLIIPSGNIMIQVVEIIALASLCSSEKMNVLDRFIKGTYSSHKAVSSALKHAEELGFNKEGIESLEKARLWYSKYSHPTMLTLSAHFPFEAPEQGLYLGACFDEAKRDEYSKELIGRVGLAEHFSNFVDGIRLNLRRW